MGIFNPKLLSKAELEWHYNPRVTVPNLEPYMKLRSEANNAALRNFRRIPDLRYGPNPNELLDIYPATSMNSPTLVYIHGGYWRAGYKEDWAFVAGPLVKNGITTAVVSYDLCPTIDLDGIVSEIHRSLVWIYENIKTYNGNPDNIFISGSSAGAHLCAMMLGMDWGTQSRPANLIKGSVLITGIYDILPVLEISVNNDIRLNHDAAVRNSPLHKPPRNNGPLVAIFGGDEAEGWKQESMKYAGMCNANRIKCELTEIDDQNHFSLGTLLGDESSLLVKTILEQVRST
tara:strand:- start:251 stop:1114 length:864 start_codon:yes stop_codon:yes gene_type:complete